MKLSEKISLLMIIRNKTNCNGLPCYECFFNGKHDEYLENSEGKLNNDQIYIKLLQVATKIALENNLITIEELFEEIL